MQRIDENTYIDDTLVTCAEYQLFIDEMRDQGEYYQPDHWTSYQFPKGLAHKPIVGVRHSDAMAFCEWLTLRQAGEWSFRIPTTIEPYQFRMTKVDLYSMGYWSIGFYDQPQFLWTGSPPANPRNLNFEFFFNSALARPLDLDVACNFAQYLARNRVLIPELTRNFASARAIDRGFNFDLVLDRARNLDLNLDLDRNLDLANDLDRARNLDLDLARATNIPSINFVNIILDLYTLQERIAGRSPAFEGIRLVKERKR